MKSETTKTKLNEKEIWTQPILKKMDVEETAVGPGVGVDGEVGS
jgi:hypothetical protein